MGQIWLVDSEAEVLRCHQAWYAGTEGLEPFRVASQEMTFASGTGLPGRTWAEKGPQWTADVQADPNSARGPAAIQAGLMAGMAAPVFAGNEVVAVLEFFTRDRRAENAAMLDLVSTVAAQLGSLILRRQADEARRDSEARFRAVAETATDAIVLAGSDGLIAYLNRGAERMFGYRLQDVQGRPLTILMPERFHQAHRHGIARFLEGGAPRVIGQTVELAGLRAVGGEFPMELSLATWDEAGHVYFSGLPARASARSGWTSKPGFPSPWPIPRDLPRSSTISWTTR